jgi:hypothetical protein
LYGYFHPYFRLSDYSRGLMVRKGLVLAVCLYLVLVISIASCFKSNVDLILTPIRAKIPAGTPREKVISTLTIESWYHQECHYAGAIEDLFFFGGHKFDNAFIVIIDYLKSSDGTLIVSSIGSYENDTWPSVYASCIDESRFER